MKFRILIFLLVLSLIPLVAHSEKYRTRSENKINAPDKTQNRIVPMPESKEIIYPYFTNRMPPRSKELPCSFDMDGKDPCEQVPEGKDVASGGTCGDGKCDDAEYHPLFPPVVWEGDEQVYVYGQCEKRCAKDCGLKCPNGEQFVWDISHCALEATMPEILCKPAVKFPYNGEFILSMNYSTLIFVCNAEQKNAKLNFGEIIWLEGQKIVLQIAEGYEQLKLYPTNSGMAVKIGNDVTYYSGNQPLSLESDSGYFACWDLDLAGLPGKEVCFDKIALKGAYVFSQNETLEEPTLFYIVRSK